MKHAIFTLCLSMFLAPAAHAAEPLVLGIEVSRPGMGLRLDVTLRHPDTGWDHYADGWEVLDENGNRLGYRKLQHPHVDEQPFTRSLSGIMVPDGMRAIYVRARCSADGWAGPKHKVSLEPSY